MVQERGWRTNILDPHMAGNACTSASRSKTLSRFRVEGLGQIVHVLAKAEDQLSLMMASI